MIERAGRQAAVAEGCYARGESFGADLRAVVEEVHRTRRRAPARRDGGDARRERHRLTGDTGVGTGCERCPRARLADRDRHRIGDRTVIGRVARCEGYGLRGATSTWGRSWSSPGE